MTTKERYGSDDTVDGTEALGNSWGRAPVGRSDTGVMTRWTERKAWEIKIARGESSGGKERYGTDDRVDGREMMGNSLGESSVGKERYGSDDSVDGGEIVGNSLGRFGESSVGKERDGSDNRVHGGEAVGK